MQVQLRVKEQLDPSWQAWFEELKITNEAGKGGLLSGELTDQAALYGVLSKIIRLGLTLVSLESSETGPTKR